MHQLFHHSVDFNCIHLRRKNKLNYHPLKNSIEFLIFISAPQWFPDSSLTELNGSVRGSQNGWGRKRSSGDPLLLLKAKSSRAGCWGPSPVGFWLSPKTKTPQTPWATFSSVQPPVKTFLCSQRIAFFSSSASYSFMRHQWEELPMHVSQKPCGLLALPLQKTSVSQANFCSS